MPVAYTFRLLRPAVNRTDIGAVYLSTIVNTDRFLLLTVVVTNLATGNWCRASLHLRFISLRRFCNRCCPARYSQKSWSLSGQWDRT